MWPCPSCTVQSVFVTKWYDSVIACAILMVGSCRLESLFMCYIITLAAFGVLYRDSCQEDMEDLEMWDCTAVCWVWGQSIMLLCHRWCVLQFAALLHGFKSLPFCTIEIRESYLLLCLTWDVVEWCRVIILLFSSITELEALHSVVIVTSRTPTLPRTFCWEVEVYEQNWSLLEFRLTALVRSNARSMSAPIFAHIKTKP